MNRDKLYLPGLADEEFIREPGVPMTKNEIRVLSLAKLRLFSAAVIYDVGSGTGSIAIECKLLFPDSQVFAVERDARALRLIGLNSEKFGIELNLIAGNAPEALADLPPADRIFIGGSGGNLTDIIEMSDKKLKARGWMVINSISLKNTAQAFDVLEAKGYRVEAIQVNIALSKTLGSSTVWQARNPVTIIAGRKEEELSALW